LCSCLLFPALSAIIDFEQAGGIPNVFELDIFIKNGQLFQDILDNWEPGNTLVIPFNRTFAMMGGIKACGLRNVTWQLDGEIFFSDDRDAWPKNPNGDVEESIYIEDIENFVITSTNPNKGVFNGNGGKWWGGIRYLIHQEDRPRTVHIKTSKNVLVENILVKDCAFWCFYAEGSDGLIIRHSDVDVRRTPFNYHTLLDLTAFNTDGFDVTGRNVHIHDCNIWCQDDCVSVKDGSVDMLIERVTCSGLGLVVGSIGSSVVRNITFRDCVMPRTVKGIYMKNRWNDAAPPGEDVASITDILYENIEIIEPQQFGIWIGPAQQAGQPCSLLWTIIDRAECDATGYQIWDNIVLRNITIINPENSPGVLLGNLTYPMTNVVFDNVVVVNPGSEPWGDEYYYCTGIEGVALGNTNPVPPCFKKQEKEKDG